MIRGLVPVFAILALLACRREESIGSTEQRAQEPPPSAGVAEPTAASGGESPRTPEVETESSDVAESDTEPPQPVFRPSPD